MLGLDMATITCLGDFRAERVPFGPKSRYKKELLVHFLSVEARDVVRSSASNLAGRGQDVGIRLEIPNGLRSSMKALQAISFDIKSKHEGAKRNILFDDEALDLVLDISIEEGKWRRISSNQAKGRKRPAVSRGGGNFRMEDGELDTILGRETGGASE